MTRFNGRDERKTGGVPSPTLFSPPFPFDSSYIFQCMYTRCVPLLHFHLSSTRVLLKYGRGERSLTSQIFQRPNGTKKRTPVFPISKEY